MRIAGGIRQPQFLRHSEIDHRLEFGRLHDRQIRRLLALQDASGIDGGLPPGVGQHGAIAHQAASIGFVPGVENPRKLVLRSEREQTVTADEAEKRIGADDEGADFLLTHCSEGGLGLAYRAHTQDMKALSQRLRGGCGIPDLTLGERSLRIHQQRDIRCVRHNLPEQLHAFCQQRAADKCCSGDVAAGTIEALNETVGDWIAAIGKHDRDFCRGCLCQASSGPESPLHRSTRHCSSQALPPAQASGRTGPPPNAWR